MRRWSRLIGNAGVLVDVSWPVIIERPRQFVDVQQHNNQLLLGFLGSSSHMPGGWRVVVSGLVADK